MKILTIPKCKHLLLSSALLICSVIMAIAAPNVPLNLRVAVHDFTMLPLAADDWTDFDTLTDNGYSSSRVLFVSSSSGNDTNAANKITSKGHYRTSDVSFNSNGIFQAPAGVIPFATIAAAYAYIRDGSSDILLLKRGDTWTGRWSTGDIGSFKKSGPSASAPIIVASYGSGPRPRIKSDLSGDALNLYGASNVIISSIYLYSPDWKSTTRGINISGTSSYITIEDCRIDNHYKNLVQGSGISNCTIRRCVFYHNNAHDGQLYAAYASAFLLEDCFFSSPYDGAGSAEGSGRALYFAAENHPPILDATIRGCIFYNHDREGADIRCGGNIYNNLFVRSMLRHGDIGSGDRSISGGKIFNNVFMEGNTAGDPCNITLVNNDNTIVHNNIFTNPAGITKEAKAISIVGDDPEQWAKNLKIYSNVIYGWNSTGAAEGGIYLSTSLLSVANIAIDDNEIQMTKGGTVLIFGTPFLPYGTFSGNKYYSAAASDDWFYQGDHVAWVSASGETGSSQAKVSYTAPERTIGGYFASLGGTATTEAFMAALLDQGRSNWNPNLSAYGAINYIRQGFDKDTIKAEYY
jgi:hypothetical protein